MTTPGAALQAGAYQMQRRALLSAATRIPCQSGNREPKVAGRVRRQTTSRFASMLRFATAMLSAQAGQKPITGMPASNALIAAGLCNPHTPI